MATGRRKRRSVYATDEVWERFILRLKAWQLITRAATARHDPLDTLTYEEIDNGIEGALRVFFSAGQDEVLKHMKRAEAWKADAKPAEAAPVPASA